MKKSIIVLILSTVLFSCKESTVETTLGGWQLTALPSDSLLGSLDRALLSYGNADSIESLTNRYVQALAEQDPDGKYAYRRPFLMGTSLFMAGEFEKGDSLRRAGISLCDSARFPQDFAVMSLAVEEPDALTDDVGRYIRYTRDLELFLHNGDNVNAATRAVQLSGLMCGYSLPAKGIEYALMADSLLGLTELDQLRNNYRINLASAYVAAGDTLRAIGLLDEVMAYPATASNSVINGIISFNKSEITGNPEDLLAAWDAIRDNPALSRFQCLVAAAFTNRCPDSITPEIEAALAGADEYTYLPEEELAIAQGRLNMAMHRGTPSEIDLETERYIEAVTANLSAARSGEVAALEFQAEISRIEAANARGKLIRNIIIMVLTVGIGLLLAVITVYYRRRIHKAERLAMLQVIESQACAYHKENVVIPPPAASRENNFMALFTGRYPSVSKTGRKIALMISEGKDVSDIARELNIRKESVLQARWRLRTQMGLTPDEDLDTAILKLQDS